MKNVIISSSVIGFNVIGDNAVVETEAGLVFLRRNAGSLVQYHHAKECMTKGIPLTLRRSPNKNDATKSYLDIVLPELDESFFAPKAMPAITETTEL